MTETPLTDKLLKAVKAKLDTLPHGSHLELAKELGGTKTQLSNWLAGRNGLKAEIALKMQIWLNRG